MNSWIPVAIAAAVPSVVFGSLALRARASATADRLRLKPIVNVEREAARLRADARSEADAIVGAATQSKAGIDAAVNDLQSLLGELRIKYAAGVARFDELTKEVGSLEEHLGDLDVGFYRPHFTFESTASYKAAIESIRERQKLLIKGEQATLCGKEWSVGGSKREGAKMVRQQEKLILRAFNAECEAAVSNVTWNNYDTMRARINKAYEVLNKAGSVLEVRIAGVYLEDQLEELKLVYEADEKRKEEKERERTQRAAQREEERVQKELAKAQADAERDERQFEKALEKARTERSSAVEEERESMSGRIAELEAKLAAAHDRKERAVAQAQLTRVGHVYIISNHGAFGEGVVKIGMTRRLEPEERIQELGDASVPFPFDLHALIYSEDAPALETRLHERFWDRRLNWANDRKEFFRIDLAELQSAIAEIGLKAELRLLAEAQEYRETLAALAARNSPTTDSIATPRTRRFGDDPFADATSVPRV